MKSRLHRASRGVGNRVCVQVVGQGIPIRLSRADAHRLVAIDHDAEYCKKSVWKRFKKEFAEYPLHPFHRINASGQIEAVEDGGL